MGEKFQIRKDLEAAFQHSIISNFFEEISGIVSSA
jgi:hypothetical protein